MLTESEILFQLQDSLKKAEGCCRQMAHWRGDIGWLKWAADFAELRSHMLKLSMTRGGIASSYVNPAHRNGSG